MNIQSVPIVVNESNPYKRQGRILQLTRIAQQKSRQDLAAEVGVCREMVRLWEIGDRAIDAVMLGRLADALQQEVRVFLS